MQSPQGALDAGLGDDLNLLCVRVADKRDGGLAAFVPSSASMYFYLGGNSQIDPRL